MYSEHQPSHFFISTALGSAAAFVATTVLEAGASPSSHTPQWTHRPSLHEALVHHTSHPTSACGAPSASSYDIAGDATSRAAAMVAASANSALIGPVARSATSSAQAAHGSHATSWQVLIWPSFWHLRV